jgi:hypothetical protein
MDTVLVTLPTKKDSIPLIPLAPIVIISISEFTTASIIHSVSELDRQCHQVPESRHTANSHLG